MRKLIIGFFIFLLMYGLPAPGCWAVDPVLPAGFSLEIAGENNLFPVDTTFSRLKEALSRMEEFPTEVFYRKHIFLSLPLWQGGATTMGVSYRQAEQGCASGGTLAFYRVIADPDYQPAKRFYDLHGDYLKYTQLGGYIGKRWGRDSYQTRIRGDLFICYDFYRLNLIGQGRIKDQPGGAKKYELYANYQRDWCADGTPPGWGYALSCDFYYQQSGFSLCLSWHNLLGGLFFRQLRQENGWIDTDEPSIGPLPIKGFTANDPFYHNLPLTTELQVAYTFAEGAKFYGDAFFGGESRTLALGYRQPFGRIAVITALNPSCKSFDFGIAVDYGELILSFGWDTTAIKGINFVVLI